MTRDTRIVMGPDGVVLAATGELSVGLLDKQLVQCEGLSPDVKRAATALLAELHQSPGRLVSVTVRLEDARQVEIFAIEALAIRRTAVNVRELLSSKLAVLLSQASAENLTLSVDVAGDVPPIVYLDAEKLAWAVTTLVGNALRYVRSASRRMPGRTISVRITFAHGSSELTIEVHDDGPGIPADTVERLFKRDGLNVQGAGLALLLMSDICAAHGGGVKVSSSIDGADHGTTVRMVLSTVGST